MNTTPETARRLCAYDTATPGLIVHDYGPDGDLWRLTHEASANALGGFLEYDDAQDAAAALCDVADWTADAQSLQSEQVIWKAIDAIEAAGGTFLCRKDGLGEQVAAKRAAQLEAQGGGE
jgi:hypothetical protein